MSKRESAIQSLGSVNPETLRGFRLLDSSTQEQIIAIYQGHASDQSITKRDREIATRRLAHFQGEKTPKK